MLSIRKAIGLESVKLEKAGVRDIVSIGGLKDVQVGDTLAHIEPECSMVFGVNDSPFAGHDGKKVFLMMSTSNFNQGFVSNHTNICVNTCGLDHLHKAASFSALSSQVSMIRKDDKWGRFMIGRIAAGVISQNDKVKVLRECEPCSVIEEGKVLSIRKTIGLESVKVEQARVGGIVSIGGFKDVRVGDTLSHMEVLTCLQPLVFEEPSFSMLVCVNDSPLAGQDCKKTIIRWEDVGSYGTRDHAVLIIGYGIEDGIDYWLCQNFWGTEYREAGYFRIERNVRDSRGTAAIAEMCYFPIIEGHGASHMAELILRK